MQYLEIVTENVEAFRISFSQIDELHLSHITESVHMDSNHELHSYKVAGSVSICVSKAANRQLSYDEGDLFSRLMRYRDITSVEIFTAQENLATEAHAEDQQDYVSYLVPWGEEDDMVNSLAEIWLDEEGRLCVSIKGDVA